VQAIAKQLENSQNAEIKANESILSALRSLSPTPRDAESARVQSNLGTGDEFVEPKALSYFIERPEYGYTETATTVEIGPRFLRITDIQEGHVDWPSVPYCTCDERTFQEKRLFPGDIVIARIGATTGKSYFISDCPPAVFASYLIRIRAIKERILPRFLYYVLQSQDYWDHIDQNKGDRLKGGVNIPVLESFEVRVPSIDRQRHIVSMLDAVEAKKDVLRESRRIVEAASDALLHHFLAVDTRREAQSAQPDDAGEATA
jgi:type I restriction enzyme S subunit